MDEGAGQSRAGMTGAGEPERLREEIEGTRRELGETVEALAAKTDVRAHAKETLERTRASAARPLPLLTVAGVTAGVALWRVSAHRRAERRRQSAVSERLRRRIAGVRGLR